MRTALVCGAGGFIGGHLVQRLKDEGYWVRGVDVKEHEFRESAADEFALVDLRDLPGLDSVVSDATGAFIGALASLKTVALHADERTRANVARAVRHGQAAGAGLDWARDLGNQPPNVCNPNFLLKEARKLSRKPNVSVSALDEKKMTELGMGAFMAVTQGSTQPGKMIIIRYNGAKKAGAAPVVLIGKGIFRS